MCVCVCVDDSIYLQIYTCISTPIAGNWGVGGFISPPPELLCAVLRAMLGLFTAKRPSTWHTLLKIRERLKVVISKTK